MGQVKQMNNVGRVSSSTVIFVIIVIITTGIIVIIIIIIIITIAMSYLQPLRPGKVGGVNETPDCRVRVTLKCWVVLERNPSRLGANPTAAVEHGWLL